MSSKLVIFDIDGTLTDGAGGGKGVYPDAHRQAFLDVFNVDIGKDFTFDRWAGQIASVCLRNVARAFDVPEQEITEDKMQKIYSLTVKYLFAHKERFNTKLLQGATEILTSLKKKGAYLAVATGNIREIGILKLEKSNLHEFFIYRGETIGGFGNEAYDRAELIKNAIAQTERLGKISLARENIFVIGDSGSDIQGALDAGVTPIGVATGFISTEELKKLGAKHAFPSLESAKLLPLLIRG